jgi:hypothetical protein
MKTLFALGSLLLLAPATGRAIDPTGAQQVTATTSQPALTIELPGADAPLNTHYSTTLMRIERRSAGGTDVDAPWLFNGFRAEQGIEFDYNTFNRYAQPPELSALPVGSALGSNTADAGNFGFGGFGIDWHGGGILSPAILDRDEGGAWLAPAAGSTINVDLGIDGPVPLPSSVVVLSADAPSSIILTSTPAARGPFVVTAVQNGRALVAVSGVAKVAVTGPVRAGDLLTTSSTPGSVQRALPGTPGTSILGAAIAGPHGANGLRTVQVRLAQAQ